MTASLGLVAVGDVVYSISASALEKVTPNTTTAGTKAAVSTVTGYSANKGISNGPMDSVYFTGTKSTKTTNSSSESW